MEHKIGSQRRRKKKNLQKKETKRKKKKILKEKKGPADTVKACSFDSYSLRAPEFFELTPSEVCKSQDFQEVLDLYAQEFQGPSEPSIPKLIDLVEKGEFRVLIMTAPDLPQGKHVSAFAMLTAYGVGSYHLEYLAVSSNCRGKGVGSLVCKSLVRFLELEGKSKAKPPKFLSLECEPRLLPFYSRLGWQNVQLEPTLWKVSNPSGIREKPFHFLAIPLLANRDPLDPSNSRVFSNVTHFRRIRDLLKAATLKREHQPP